MGVGDPWGGVFLPPPVPCTPPPPPAPSPPTPVLIPSWLYEREKRIKKGLVKKKEKKSAGLVDEAAMATSIMHYLVKSRLALVN